MLGSKHPIHNILSVLIKLPDLYNQDCICRIIYTQPIIHSFLNLPSQRKCIAEVYFIFQLEHLAVGVLKP